MTTPRKSKVKPREEKEDFEETVSKRAAVQSDKSHKLGSEGRIHVNRKLCNITSRNSTTLDPEGVELAPETLLRKLYFNIFLDIFTFFSNFRKKPSSCHFFFMPYPNPLPLISFDVFFLRLRMVFESATKAA